MKKISEDDSKSLGFNLKKARPEWMILTVLPVCPPIVRPTSRSGVLDPITYKLSEIIKYNNILKRHLEIGASLDLIQELTALLQYHVATYIDEEIPDHKVVLSTGKDKSVQSIRQRLEGRHGRMRGNILGKTVNFTAQTLVTPDPYISIDEIGIPRSIARSITYPERVTQYNFEKLRNLISIGVATVKKDGVSLEKPNEKDCSLEFNCIVERQLQDGDLVLLNKQPCTQRTNLMGCYVKVLPYSTFRINPVISTPCNMNYGDEINIHIPQTEEVRAEIQELLLPSRNIILPYETRPSFGITQDALLGCKLFTSRDTFVEKDLLMNLLMNVSSFDGTIPPPSILKPKSLWTGKQIFSMIVPNINLTRYSNGHNSYLSQDIPVEDTKVLIHNGELLAGIVDKRTVGSYRGSLVHIILEEYGRTGTKVFLEECQQLICEWLAGHGFSVGIEDLITNGTYKEETIKIIDNLKKNVESYIRRRSDPYFDNGNGVEKTINNLLNSATNSNHIRNSISYNNSIKEMASAGSKGCLLNLFYITTFIGQLNINKERISYGFCDRTLPHFTKYDISAESRGFVQNSFCKGLSPCEFFFSSMFYRMELSEKNPRTLQHFSFQRKLIKFMENVIVQYDKTVRNSYGNVIQFNYGDDGMTGTSCEVQRIGISKLTNQQLHDIYEYNDSADLIIFKNEYEQLLSDREWLLKNTNNEDNWQYPVDLQNLIVKAKERFPLLSDLQDSPLTFITKLKNLTDKLTEISGNETLLFNILLRSKLSSRRVIEDYQLSPNAFDWIMQQIETKFEMSSVNPGDSVGVFSGQSIGGLFTLNNPLFIPVFRAGVFERNIDIGIPRLNEILTLSKNSSLVYSEYSTIYLKKEFSRNCDVAKSIACKLQYCTLRDITLSIEIYYDPFPLSTVIDRDQSFVSSHYELEEVDDNKLSPWLLRIELCRRKITYAELSMYKIYTAIMKDWEHKLSIILSDDNADELILRVNVIIHPTDNENEINFNLMKQIADKLLETRVSGAPGIKKVFLREISTRVGSDREWILDTQGINLLACLTTSNVDHTRTISNNVHEVMDVLGIEAARTVIINEIKAIVDYFTIFVDYRQIALLADVMTYRGYLESINHKSRKYQTSPIESSFLFDSIDSLMDASCFNETDNLKGITGSILTGKLPNIGTSFCVQVYDKPQ